MTLDPDMIDRIAAAIESAQVGYSLTLTRLLDEERTYTLTYSDGTPPLTFDDIDDGYLHISERKRRAQAAAVIAALEPPEIDGGRFADWSLATIARQCRAQSREQLDPEFSQFMAEVARRLFGAFPFQDRVSAAHHAIFHDDPTDIAERRARFFEESNETCQALGMTEDEAIALVRYTYGRPAGEPKKEIGAAALTLASLCVVAGYDMMECAEADLEKLQRPETIARIRAKRSTRHGRGPLPGFDPATVASGGDHG